MARRCTLSDVARAAGVSTATVSMVLNDKPNSRVTEATAAKVRATAHDLGYVLDHTARTLRTGRTGTIGFLSDEVTITRFASPMIEGILAAADARDHTVLIMETGDSAERFERASALMRARRVDALAVGLMDSREIALPPAPERGARVIVNGNSPGTRAILPDNFEAGRRAVELLIAHGHRRIGLIGRWPTRPTPTESVTIGPRFDGMDAAMAGAGLQFAAEHHGTPWHPDLGFVGVHTVLDQAPDVTAILAANDRIAFGVYQALGELRLSVPHDISVLSFDDEVLAGLMRPGLTTLRLPYREMGALAADILIDALSGSAPLTVGTTLLPLKLVERQSVRSL